MPPATRPGQSAPPAQAVELLRYPREADLAGPAVALLTDDSFGPFAQQQVLLLAGGPLAQRYAAQVLRRPLVVLTTPGGHTGLDAALAEDTANGLHHVLALEWKGPGTKPQHGRITALTDPQLPEAHRLDAAIAAAVSAGTLVLDPHENCVCSFTYGGEPLWYKRATSRSRPGAIRHVLAQTTQLGYASAARAAVVVPSAWNRCSPDASIATIDPDVRGAFVTVEPLDAGLGDLYGPDGQVWPWRWHPTTYRVLLAAWAEVAATMQLPAATLATLRTFAGRLWLAAAYEDVHTWPANLLALVPPELPATYPCPNSCCRR